MRAVAAPSSQYRLDKQISQISATSGSSMSGFLPSFPTFGTSFDHVSICSSNAAAVHAAALQAAQLTSTATPNAPRFSHASSAEQTHATTDDLADTDGSSTSRLLATTAVPRLEEDGTSDDSSAVPAVAPSCINPLPSQLANEMSALLHPPSLHPAESPAIMHAMLTSSAPASESADALPGIAASSHEATVPVVAVAVVSDSVPLDPPAQPFPALVAKVAGGASAAGTDDLEGKSQSTALSPVPHILSCEQEELSPHSSSHHSWVTAPEGAVTGSSCGGSLADFDPITSATVTASPQSHYSVSPVPLAIPAASAFQPGAALRHAADDDNADSSMLSVQLPDETSDVCADAAFACGAATSMLSRMSAANSQVALLQHQPGSEYAVPSRPTAPFTVGNLAACAGQQPLVSPSVRHSLPSAGSIPQLSPSSEGPSGERTCRLASGAPITRTSNPLFRPLHNRTNSRQQPSASTAAAFSSAATDARPAGGLLRRTGSSLKRALSRSLHTVKSFAASRKSGVQQPTAGATLESSPRHGEQQRLQRRSFVPKSSLFRSIQESILSITDDEGEHYEHSAGPDAHLTPSAVAADVVATMSESPLRGRLAPPAGGHAVHRSADLEPFSVPAGLHTPHSRTTSAQSGPQLLPPSPAALVGSQLSESVSSQGQSVTDASPALVSPGVHLVTPGRVPMAHGQQAVSLLERPGDEELAQSAPLRSRHYYQGQRSADEQHQHVRGMRHASTLRRRSALAACFCGVLDQHSVDLGAE